MNRVLSRLYTLPQGPPGHKSNSQRLIQISTAAVRPSAILCFVSSACKMKAGSKICKAMSMMSLVQLHGVCRLYVDKSSTHRHLYTVHPKPLVSEAIRPKLQPQHASLAAIRNTVQHHGRICVNHDRRQCDNVASSHRLNSNTKTAASSSSSSSSPWPPPSHYPQDRHNYH